MMATGLPSGADSSRMAANAALVPRAVAVGLVEADDVHAGRDERADHLARLACGPERRDDLGALQERSFPEPERQGRGGPGGPPRISARLLDDREPELLELAAATSAGAPVIGQMARWVFGNAITSRSESAPQRIITSRSRPKAKPPCGGAPYLRAARRKPNFSSASAGPMPSMLEDRLLHLRAVDTDAAAAELDAVEDEVVRARGAAAGVGGKRFGVGVRRGS